MVKYLEPLNISLRKIEIYERRINRDNVSSMEEAYQILKEAGSNVEKEFIQGRRESLGKI